MDVAYPSCVLPMAGTPPAPQDPWLAQAQGGVHVTWEDKLLYAIKAENSFGGSHRILSAGPWQRPLQAPRPGRRRR